LQRNKHAILASGLDPKLRRLRQLQAIRSNCEKKLIKALEDIETYWERVNAAIEGPECR